MFYLWAQIARHSCHRQTLMSASLVVYWGVMHVSCYAAVYVSDISHEYQCHLILACPYHDALDAPWSCQGLTARHCSLLDLSGMWMRTWYLWKTCMCCRRMRYWPTQHPWAVTRTVSSPTTGQTLRTPTCRQVCINTLKTGELYLLKRQHSKV